MTTPTSPRLVIGCFCASDCRCRTEQAFQGAGLDARGDCGCTADHYRVLADGAYVLMNTPDLGVLAFDVLRAAKPAPDGVVQVVVSHPRYQGGEHLHVAIPRTAIKHY